MVRTKSAGWRRVAALIGLLSAMALGLSACTSTPPVTTPPPPGGGDGPSGTITLWHFFEDREARVIQDAVDAFVASHPDIKVEVQSGQDDDKMRQAIAANQPIDVGISYSSDLIGPLCSTGAFKDLSEYIARDNIDLTQISDVVLSYTEFDGVRCAMPALTDVTGFYYNKDLLDAAGVAVPKTLDELAAAAVKLTTHNADGSIDVLGFNPLTDYYETNLGNLAVMGGATWLKADGTSAIGTDPAWRALLNWQKKLIKDLGGYDALSNWKAASGDEFSEENDFQTGRIAMMIDGEWRTAFIADEAPDLNYGTAPTPVANPADYGAGLIDGNLIGIPRGSLNPDAAWELVKYIALDVDAQVMLGNGLKNVPTVAGALTSPNLEADANYQTFLDIYSNPNSKTEPRTINGTDYMEHMGNFVEQWENGDWEDTLEAGLAGVDVAANDAMALGG